jgi:hypothetical protein
MRKKGFLPVVALAIVTGLAGCHKNDQEVDAAENGNLAPVSDYGQAAPVEQAPQSAPA